MSAVVYRCPNCGGQLHFEPDSGNFICKYCDSSFEKSYLDSVDAKHNLNILDREASGDPREYECPNCGACVVSDDTDAAVFCYYCGSPVVVSDRLSGEFKPDGIIPFMISEEKANEAFRSLCKKKMFLPRDFMSEKKNGQLKGVYLPYWLVDSKVDGEYVSRSKKVRVWHAGDIEYTETTSFRHVRQGTIEHENIAEFALSSEDKNLIKNVCPYNCSEIIPFEMPFLSGFLAEKRDIEKNDIEASVDDKIRSLSEGYMNGTVSTTVTQVERMNFTKLSEKWRYVLLPVWVKTYKYAGKTYTYAMNGQTGKITGQLPVSRGKLAGLFAGVTAGSAAVVTLFMLVFGGWLF